MILGFPGGNSKDFFYNKQLQIFFRLPERKFKAFPHNTDIHVFVTYNKDTNIYIVGESLKIMSWKSKKRSF